MNENTNQVVEGATIVYDTPITDEFIDGQPDLGKVFERHYRAERDLLETLTEERRQQIIKELGYDF